MNEARVVALFALSAGPAACARLAWVPAGGRPGLSLFGLTLLLGVATVLGESLEGQLPVRQRGAQKARVWVLSLVAGLVSLIVAFAAAFPNPALLSRQVAVLIGLQLVMLLLPGLATGRLPVLGLALALSVLASFRGGSLAALAVLSFVAGLGLYLGLDHFTRRLAGRDSFSQALHGIAFRETLRAIAAPIGVVILLFTLVPPAAHIGFASSDLEGLLERDEMASAYMQLALFCVSGATLIYYLSRLLRQRRRGRAPAIEDVAVEQGAEEALPPRRTRPAPAAPGARGSIGRAYARFLAAANGLVFVRRIDQTPDEIATLVRSPGAALSRLTSLFRDARYGARDPSGADASEADSLAEDLIAWLRSRSAPPSRRY